MRSGKRRCLRIECDVAGNDQIELTVAIVIEKAAPCRPLVVRTRDTGLHGDILERAFSVIAIKRVRPPVRDEQILIPVVVEIARTHAVAPARAGDSGCGTYVGEFSGAGVPIEMADRFLTLRKSLEAGSVYEEDIEASIVVVVDETPRRFHSLRLCIFCERDRPENFAVRPASRATSVKDARNGTPEGLRARHSPKIACSDALTKSDPGERETHRDQYCGAQTTQHATSLKLVAQRKLNLTGRSRRADYAEVVRPEHITARTGSPKVHVIRKVEELIRNSSVWFSTIWNFFAIDTSKICLPSSWTM